MKKEEKELLKKDLCARIPYGVWCEVKKNEFDTSDIQLGINNIGYLDSWESCKPYLRPMSSMTKKEREEYDEIVKITLEVHDCEASKEVCLFLPPVDWLISRHFDIRGLIEKGIVLKAKEGMYEY